MITLTTDFGLSDPYVGLMKGIILGIAPAAAIVDLTHDVAPQDVLGAALVIERAIGCFPENTIHVVVVDPGVGSGRRAVAVRAHGNLWIGPDNGVLTTVLDAAQPDAVSLTRPEHHRRSVSATFHGRDVFAPIAARLESGMPMASLGDPARDLVRLDLPTPERTADGLTLHVLHADRFGNLVTDLDRQAYDRWRGDLPLDASGILRIDEVEIGGLSRTYADVPEGAALAYFGSGGRLEIAVRNGSAADRFDPSTASNRIVLSAGSLRI
ncbi:MAG: hypothetical protein CMJ18_13355 [Phycisphaeraceae bacterium]|nr:hypothetical protein [Phycisphaeraceae bacterium]